MDRRIIIIIGIIVLIVAAGIIFLMLNSVSYERIEITPNGTTIEVPANQTKYNGDIESIKVWNWDKGVLVSYNSFEDSNNIKLSEMSFNALNELIKNGNKQTIDGVTCYVINADELLEIQIFDVVKVNYNGKLYCISLANETSHDNIIICSNDQDIAVHMAKSVEYKNVYPNKVNSTIDNLTGGLVSEANDYLNNVDLNNVDLNNVDLNNVKSSVEEKAGDFLSKNQISL